MTTTEKTCTMPVITAAEPHRGTLQGRHVLAMMIAFFGVVFAVNGVFLYQAIATYTGVVSVEPYRKGLRYNERIEAERRQDALGWRDSVELDASGRLSLQLADEAGRPVGGLKIAAVVGRPSTGAGDKRLVLEETSPGHYAATASALDAGAWLVTIETDGNGSGIYRLRKRIWLTPTP